MIKLSLIFVVIMTVGCGRARYETVGGPDDKGKEQEQEAPETPDIDIDIDITIENPPPEVEHKPPVYPDPPPNHYGYVSCYSWNTGAPLYGPKKSTALRRQGNRFYIKQYPSGRWVSICADCEWETE